MSICKLVGAFLAIYNFLIVLYFYLQYLWGNINFVQMTYNLIMLLIPSEVNVLMAFPNIIGVIIILIMVIIKRRSEDFV